MNATAYPNSSSMSAPTATNNTVSTGGIQMTSYTTNGYINGIKATTNTGSTNIRSGWSGKSINNMLGKSTNNGTLQSQMYWAFISNAAICGNDQIIVEAQ